MDSNVLSLRLRSEAVDEQLHLERLGFWLRMARERAGKSQEGAAQELRLSAKSKSTISDWENGHREPALRQLRLLARYYKAPLEVFIDPPPTAFEELDRLVALAGDAIAAAQQDWVEEGETDPDVDDEPGAPPRRRSA